MIALSLFTVLAFTSGLLFWYRLGGLLNPPSLSAFSLGGASGLALLFDAQKRAGADLHAGFGTDPTPVAIIFSVALLAFVMPWARQRKLTGSGPAVPYFMVRTLLQLGAATLFLLALTWGLLGRVPILSMMFDSYSIFDHLDSIKLLPLGLMMFNLLFATILSLYIASVISLENKSPDEIIVLFMTICVAAFAALWQGNRQVILIFLFFVGTRYLLRGMYDSTFFKPKRSFLRALVIAACCLAFVALFTLINYLRLSAVGRSSGPLELALYYAWPVYNMGSLHDHLGYWGLLDPSYLLAEILPARLGGKDIIGQMQPLLFEPTSPSGYVSYWYVSLGLPGVFVGCIAFSSWCRWVYGQCLKSEGWMQVYVITLWGCATLSVYSHPMTTAFYWFPVVCIAVAHGASRITVGTNGERNAGAV